MNALFFLCLAALGGGLIVASFKTTLDRFCDYREVSSPSVTHATFDVIERTARKVLRLKKRDPLIYRGLALTCRGSRAWRQRHPEGVAR